MTVDDDLNAAALAARNEIRSRHLQPEDLAAYAVAEGQRVLAWSMTNCNLRPILPLHAFVQLVSCIAWCCMQAKPGLSRSFGCKEALQWLSIFAFAGADEDLAAAVGNQAPAAGGIVSVRASGGSASSAKPGVGGKKGSMLYAKQESSKKRGSPFPLGKKGPKKQKK
eukprot:739675-Pelagomonas_calceolata.AAC.3